MTPEFDEEVVFENSPLYQYLQDLGHTDFEICSSLSPKTEKCTTEGQQKPPPGVLSKQGILLKVAETIKSWICFSQCSKKDDLLHKLDTGFRLDSLHTILQQEVLLQEDVELIELLDPSILSAGQAHPQEHEHLPTLCSLATPNIWDISMLFAFLGLLIVLPTWWIVSSWLVWGVRHLYSCITFYFSSLLDRVSAACSFNKASQPCSPQLAGLRKAVYRTVHANFQAARLATLHMLKNYPLNSESDNVTNYLCVVPFKELGLGLSEEQISEEEAHRLTDGFGLPALKVLFQLWVAQSSEFFRRLNLLLSTAHLPQEPKLNPRSLPPSFLAEVTQGLPSAHAACLEELRRSYEFHRHFEKQHRPASPRTSCAPQKSRELSSVHTAVRSLQLHLKALLNEVIILEDELEKLVCTKETQELVSEVYQILEQKLKLIEPHVQASNSCWEEAISQVDKLLRRNTDKKGKPQEACENPHCTAVPLPQPALHIVDEDPIPDLQELEAYVDDVDVDSDFRKDDLFYLSQEDKERQKQEQEESKRVLQELKSVLGFRASEAERQKWKQLLFSEHAVLKPLCPVDAERQKWKQLLFSEHAVLKPLCPVDAEEPLSNSEPSVNSDLGKVSQNDAEAEASAPSVTDSAINRTEYSCGTPPAGENAASPAGEALPEAMTGARVSIQGDSEAAPKPPAAAQCVLPQRLARLQLSPELSFTAGLAAQAADRSLSFTTMQEQTFGDEDEEQVMEEKREDPEGQQEPGYT
ncbi:LOW QUALITY PROTEIN: vezatin [Octodon degus]|uniref:Vezatin n=1 Tax=Octodon degus TaxID=10160 RepID=A0A6P6ENC5_OCTDE|nr:LOW QUALITY PROTEIN: vezatin [Octodon degus]